MSATPSKATTPAGSMFGPMTCTPDRNVDATPEKLRSSRVPASQRFLPPMCPTNQDGLPDVVCHRDDVPSRDGHVRARIYGHRPMGQATQDGGAGQVAAGSSQLNTYLLLGWGKRLREEILLLEVIFQALFGLGAGNAWMRPTASWTLICRQRQHPKDVCAES